MATSYYKSGSNYYKKTGGSVQLVSKSEYEANSGATSTTKNSSSKGSTSSAPQSAPQSTTSDALRNMSIANARGDTVTQEQIDAGELSTGGAKDYVTQLGLEPNNASPELRNMSIANARNQGATQEAVQQPEIIPPLVPDATPQGGQAGQINAAYQRALQANQGTQGASQGASQGTLTGAQPTYVNANGAYFQETPLGLAAVSNPEIISGLRSGSIPSNQVSPFIAGGLNFAPTAMGPNGELMPQEAVPEAQITFQGLSEKYGLSQSQQTFQYDPISSIGDITKQVLSAMGYDSMSSETKKITKELEDLENERDEKIRDINDNPWLTEGVRLRQISKVEQEYEDKIGNRTNRLNLLDGLRDDARQQAQFAIGTAVSIWDSNRNFQMEQLKLTYDQAQRDFDNSIKMRQLELASQPQSTNIDEFLFAKENGYGGNFYDWMNPVKGGTSSAGSSFGGGLSVVDSSGQSFQISPAAEGWARTILEGNGTLNNIPASEKSIYGGSLRTEVAQLLQSPILAQSQLARVDRHLDVINELMGRDYEDITGLAQTLPMTFGKSYTVKLYNQVKAILSINAREQMKGSGAISDFEAQQLSQSETALSRTLSNEDFKRELEKIQAVFEGARIRHATNAQLWTEMTNQAQAVQQGGQTYVSSSGKTYQLPN